MTLCLSLVIIFVMETLYYVKSEVCSKCSCTDSGFVVPASFSNQVLISSDYTENIIGLQKCSWIIMTNNSSHAITFKMTKLIAHKAPYCGEDFVLVRDGNSEKGPPLGFWCRDGTYDLEVTSYSSSIYVELETYSNGVAGTIFVMSFWESSVSSSVQYGPIEYGVVNYVLIALSVLIGSLLIGAVTYLIHREYIKNKEMKETKFREKLLMRRTGISGRSGGIVNEEFRHDSESEKNTSFIYLSPTPTSEISV